MKTTKFLTILFTALCLMFCQAGVSEAAPLSTAFTYQGHLYDANGIANGPYDFQFKLFDDPNIVTGNQVGSDVNAPDVDVIDAQFTVELDFGSDVFDGDARWLEIGVRPGDQNDPNTYTTLSPRQEVTTVPYALQTRGIFVDESGNVGIGTDSPTTKLHVKTDGPQLQLQDDNFGEFYFQADYNGVNNRLAIFNNNKNTEVFTIQDGGNVGIGTTSPDYKFQVEESGTVIAGVKSTVNNAYVLIDRKGAADRAEFVIREDGSDKWYMGMSDSDNAGDGTEFYIGETAGGKSPALWIESGGNVGIGTDTPYENLHVSGSTNNVVIRIEDTDGGYPGLQIRNPDEYYNIQLDLDGDLYFYEDDGGTKVLIENGTGNVGIGTQNPGAKLEVNGQVKITDGSQGAGKVLTSDAAGLASWQNPAGGADDDWAWSSGSGLTGDIYHTGNVGIGMDSPSEKLDVVGYINTSWAYKIGGDTVLSTLGTSNIFVGDDAGTSTVAGSFNSAMGTEALYSNTSGNSNTAVGFRALRDNTVGEDNVAVGSGALRYSGSDDNTAVGYNAGGGSIGVGSSNVFLGYKAGFNSTGGNKLYIENTDSSSPLIYGEFNNDIVRINGDLGVGRNPAENELEVEGNASKTAAGDWLANSDVRIKTDIQTVTGALDTLDKVRLVSFKYTDDYRNEHSSVEDRRYLNVIAQEFREVFPGYVKTSGEKLPNGDEILQVDAYPLTVYSAAAVQELHDIVKAKDAEVMQLKERVSKMEALLAKLADEQEGGQR